MEGASFKKETVMKLVQHNFTDEKTKVNADASWLMTELINVFVAEGAERAAKRAEAESCPVVNREHFEKILPQLLLDF